jgi:urease accessory protein
MSYTGKLELVARKRGERTQVASCYYEGAFKLTRPVYLESTFPCVYFIHVGGGYVDGDTYLTNLLVEEGAELAVTTQSFTKVYKTPRHPVIQKTVIKLEKTSTLHYMPDPLIAYEGSKFSQETIVHLEENACLFYKDIITPGWAEDARLFRYDWIRSKLKVFKKDKLFLLDHLFLNPDEDLSGLMQMEGYTHVGTFMIFHDKVGKPFLDAFYEKMETFPADARWGVSLLPEGGMILRVLAFKTGIIEQIITQAYRFARKVLFDKADLAWRKY